MKSEARVITAEEHINAQETIKNRKSYDVLKRFMNDVMNGRECDPKDALIVVYAITNAMLKPGIAKAMGLENKGRGGGSKTSLSGYSMENSVIASIVLEYRAGLIKESQACGKIREMIGDGQEEAIDSRTINGMLKQACEDYGGLYELIGESGVKHLFALVNQQKSAK